jgi:hypothetical protein
MKRKFEIALRLRHPSMDPTEITLRLGINPSYCYRAGDPRVTPKGSALTGTNKESFWYADLPVEDAPSIADGLRISNASLVPHKIFLNSFVDDGGTVEYFIGWFIDGNSGEVLDWSLLKECAELKVAVQFDVYGPSESVVAEVAG